MTESPPQTASPALAQTLRKAIAHHRAGQVQDAERLYRGILQAQPDHPDANHNLGVLMVQAKQPAAGLPHFKAALEANPKQGQYWLSYIDALIRTGQTDAARAVLEQGRQRGLQGAAAAALAGRLEAGAQDAMQSSAEYQHVFKRSPPVLPEVSQDIASETRHAGTDESAGDPPRMEQAEPGSQEIDTLQALFAERKYPEAAILSQTVTERYPMHGFGWKALGAVFKQTGRSADALAAMQKAAALLPADAEVHSNLGATLQQLGRLDEAEASCRRALEIQPDFAEAHINLGNTLKDRGRLEDAEASYRRALQIKPDYAEAHNNLGNTLKELGRIEEAEASYRQALHFRPDHARAHSNLLFCLNCHPHRSAADVYAEHRRWDEQQAAACVRVARPPGDRDPQRRLRVGYVSPDLRTHSVAYFFEPLLRAHDHQVIESFCYAEVARPDAVTARLQGLSDHWLSTVGMSDETLARRIAEDGIDILVDLAGHTADNRLLVFARKPAPVQVTWLGYAHSTGMRAMDYRLVDAVTDPAGDADAQASETLVRLDDGFLCYAAPADAPLPAAPPSLTQGCITFGSFNNPAKLSSLTLDAWALLLGRVPGSRLLAKGWMFADAGGRTAFLAQLAQRGVDVQRVTLLGQVPGLKAHLSLYEQVDIALDPFPYNGTTTTCEALWMGVPVVSLRGDRHAARVGASLLEQIGLTELIADSTQDYVDIAAALAGDAARLGGLRRTLRARMAASSLCDAPAFARKMEAAYRAMWRRHCDGAGQTTLVLVDGVRIVVPDSLELITTYVLQEQQDWFEDEIKFLRRLMQPGQKVIDIGANYGVYTLSMARTVGPTGCVWAFEPASRTARMLAEGIAVNGFAQIVLEQSALSDTCGTAQLSLNENSELNALVHGGPSTDPSETVSLVTLDRCLERYGWQDIGFMKIDAEGEEASILKGGVRFFTELSPLVQYEIKAGADLHLGLVKDFAALGYDSYRLVPGLGMLARFDAESTPDAYLLNLFCCKQDRAARLAARGLLLDSSDDLPGAGTGYSTDISEHVTNRDAYDWRNTLARLPYGAGLAALWLQTVAAGDGAAVEQALSLYAFSRDTSQSAPARWRALTASLGTLTTLCGSQPSHLRLASLARVAQDYGARGLAVRALQQLVNTIRQHNRVDPSEPFLAPGRRFDSIPPGVSIADWVLAGALEEFERLASFSSFYTGVSARQRLEDIRALGFGSDEMGRRLRLLQKRFGLPAS